MRYFLDIKKLSMFSGILLFLAIPEGLPYYYYILLRLLILISASLVAYTTYRFKKLQWAIIFGAIAILFNPILPIYLDKQIWIPIDFAVGTLFFLTPRYVFNEKGILSRKDKTLYSFALIGYFLFLFYKNDIGFGLLGAFIGGWIAVFFITYVLRE